jgi:hypothetical protein
LREEEVSDRQRVERIPGQAPRLGGMGGEEGAGEGAVDMNRVLRETAVLAQKLFVAKQEVGGN